MIPTLAPYPAYKDSGAPWLGAVPEHWKVVQIRHIGRLIKGVGGTKEDAAESGVPCVRYGELYTTYNSFIRKPRTFVSLERAKSYTPIRYGDVLFAASGEKIEEIGKSAVNLLQEPAVCGGDVVVLRLTVPAYPPFLGYVSDSYPVAHQKASMGRGTTIKHIYPDELRALFIPLPPLAEQQRIAAFLDHVDRRVNRFIRAKRRMIALLNEQKQAIIHQAVTRGLDPHVKLKPSGVAWLGDVPEGWEIKKIKHLTDSVGGMTPSKAEPSFWNGDIPWVSPKDMKLVEIKDTIDHISLKAITQTKITVIKPPAVLIVVRGMILTRRFPVAVSVSRVTLNQDMKALLVNASLVNAYFLRYLLTGLGNHIVTRLVEESGHGTRCLRTDAWQNFLVPVPPLLEQSSIVEYLDIALNEANQAIERLNREIALIREYRTRLIADVVTGKLDVRGVALPAAPGEPAEAGFDDAEEAFDDAGEEPAGAEEGEE
jgi:type I restriction enzyme S subunit